MNGLALGEQERVFARLGLCKGQPLQSGGLRGCAVLDTDHSLPCEVRQRNPEPLAKCRVRYLLEC